MTDEISYPMGAPCWVGTLQPDPHAAVAFYGGLFGWEFDAPTADGHHVARLGGRRVAGVGPAPAWLDRGAWVTYVRVADLDETTAIVEASGGHLLPDTGTVWPTALFTDPSGAAIGVCEGVAPTFAEAVDVPGAWQMSALHTPDLAGGEVFYAKVFGWRLEAGPGTGRTLWRLPGSVRRAADPTLPDDVVAVATGADPAAGVPPHWAVNMRVADTRALAERAVALGGTILMPPTDAPGFRNAVLADPGGAVLALSQIL
ncbi:VOC family protein [Nocardia blacklockiae]|uniref:VOC family protein n=1 Tax=Nocardia blacklockiae TaxID=480036 RepID=UPI001893CF80|nr:VOC family protein [Nocardia blacklockiae]MBF6170413.1 VOC family protein [Nocardia blacklockiae]